MPSRYRCSRLISVGRLPSSGRTPRPNPTGSVGDGLLNRLGTASDNRLMAAIEPVADVFAAGEFRLEESQRRVFGIAVRTAGDEYLLVRYYDRPRALEVLAFDGGEWKQVGQRGPVTSVEAGVWYRLEVAVCGDELRARLWPAAAERPAWQVATEVPEYAAGSVAIVGHDDTRFAVRSFAVYDDHPELAELERRAAEAKAERLAKLTQSLRLVAVAEAFPKMVEGQLVRRVHVVPSGRERPQPDRRSPGSGRPWGRTAIRAPRGGLRGPGVSGFRSPSRRSP